MENGERRPKVLLADKGYDSDAIREDSWMHGTNPVIPTKSNRRIQRPVDPALYALRHKIECFKALGSASSSGTSSPPVDALDAEEEVHVERSVPAAPLAVDSTLKVAIADDLRRRKVFITHGKNRDLVDPVKKLLEFGEMEAVVSVERQSVSKPVPEKVMDDMRACGGAIIHVDADAKISDAAGQEHVVINPNVLIEIGAAMAFYGRRFILLVREGVKLPSNLQGLYEVRYSGDTLDAHSTIRLLEAIKDIKNHPLPGSQ